jgi:hypothetical protein
MQIWFLLLLLWILNQLLTDRPSLFLNLMLKGLCFWTLKSKLDARFLLLNEKVQPGKLLDLTVFTVLVGERVVSDSIVHANQMGSTSSGHPVDSVAISREHLADNSLQSDGFHGLDFNPGKGFANECLKKFGQNVNLGKFASRRPFFLVCSFGRACFRLDVHTVALALQACFGGSVALYNVKALRD